MKNKKVLACTGEAYDYKEEEILTPIKLDKKDLEKLTVTVCGYEFIDTGYALACPECGLISGLNCRLDIDKKVDFFLKFGCEHYKEKK